ncbi:MAG TPA: hypothetical protein EYN66_23280 [Myxococcales bacterium]|nr:hypothetical protein [Myxococcales bacterium]
MNCSSNFPKVILVSVALLALGCSEFKESNPDGSSTGEDAISDGNGTTGDDDSGTTTSDEDVGTTTSDEDVGTTTSDEDVGTTTSDEDVGTTTSDGDVGTTTSDEDVGTTTSDEDAGTTGDEDAGTTGDEDTTAPECTPENVVTNCDDGNNCTNDTCNQAGECTHIEDLLGKCKIDNICYGNNQINPESQCKYCDASSPLMWSPVECNDNDPCNGEETCETATGCAAGTPLDCGIYTCDSNGCLTSCSNDSECSNDTVCMNNECAGPQSNGSECSGNGDCLSEHCKNNVCCASGECCQEDIDCSGYSLSIDQANDYLGTKSGYHEMSGMKLVAQSFTVGESGYLNKVAIYLAGIKFSSTPVKVMLYTGEFPGAADSVFVTSKQISVTSTKYHDVVWSAPVEVLQGQQYTIVAKIPECVGGKLEFCLDYKARWYNHPTTNSYSGGGAYIKNSIWQSPFPQTDRLFKTWVQSKFCGSADFKCY